MGITSGYSTFLSNAYTATELLDCGALLSASLIHFIRQLEPHPEALTRPKVSTEAQIVFGGAVSELDESPSNEYDQ